MTLKVRLMFLLCCRLFVIRMTIHRNECFSCEFMQTICMKNSVNDSTENKDILRGCFVACQEEIKTNRLEKGIISSHHNLCEVFVFIFNYIVCH